LAVVGEAGLLVLAWALGRWLGILPGDRLYLTSAALFMGVAAAVPLLLGLRWALTTSLEPVRHVVQLVQDQLGPVLASRSSVELALLATLAGVAEEVLFRGVLQVGFSRVVSSGAALVLASAVFGLAHFLTRTYALLAGVAGLYLGALFWMQGNLLVPIVAHSLYDFFALTLLVRRYRARGDMAS
jgi:membrane protease YdiL (CAAX protease family)